VCLLVEEGRGLRDVAERDTGCVPITTNRRYVQVQWRGRVEGRRKRDEGKRKGGVAADRCFLPHLTA
jgi:hypothetical protein